MVLPWKEIERIFHEVRLTAISERAALLDQRCDGDRQARLQVESLLRHHGQPTVEFAASIQPVAAAWVAASQDHDPPPPEMLGPYRIERQLGQGGMGSVYLATDTRLGRQVAVKVIRGSVAHTSNAKARFLREAQTAAALAHPNIAMVHDYGEAGERPWLVMEYIDGWSLRSQMQSGAISESLLMDYAAQVASALEHAHARRIVHGDIKPENIMVSGDGCLKLVDFGLANILSDETSGDGATSGTVFATPAYAAPELISGGRISARTDVFSFGVVLWELAHGCTIGEGEQRSRMDSTTAVSSGVRNFIERCLSPNPSSRYPGGEAIATALRTIRTKGLIAPAVSRSPVIAILDFRALGASGELDWLGTGIAESLWADLAKLKEVKVAHRGRMHHRLDLAGQPHYDADSAAELARELAIDWMVAGTLQQFGDRIRVNATVTETATGEVTAVEKVDGLSQDLFGLQDRLAEALILQLRLRLGSSAGDAQPAPKAPSLAAYEHYIRGRKQMYQMRETSLTEAIKQLQQAVALDSEYALAFSALGTAHALQFLRTSNPADVARASEYLERATRLDPELGEPYPWLAYIRVRQNNPLGALAAGEKGILLQPDLPEAQYFCGGLSYMLAEHPDVDHVYGLQRLIEAVRIQPKFHPAWIAAGALAMYLGKYENAIDLLKEAIRIELEPDLQYHFEGARTHLGSVYFRLGNIGKSIEYHVEALQKLSRSGHLYRSTFRILSACGLGAIELREGNPNASISHYRSAWQTVKENPRIAGNARLHIRAGAGLAAAYAAANEADRARELLSESYCLLDSVVGEYANITLECSFGQLCLDLAVAERKMGNVQQAEKLVRRAIAMRWKDFSWLFADPMLKGLYSNPGL